MSDFKPARLYFAFGSQPFKVLYFICALLTLYLVWLPYWALISVRTEHRPRKSWSFTRTLALYQLRYLSSLFERIGGAQEPPNHLVMDEDPKVNGVWIDPIPDDLVVGEIKGWADMAKVRPTKIPGYWIFGNESTKAASSTSRANEKVILYFHGGAYIIRSAHPHDPIANIARGLIDAGTPYIHAALSLEYRLSSGTPLADENPFPAAILDALSGYAYLLKLGYLPENIIVAGDSAGANLVLALARYTVDAAVQGVTGSSDEPRFAPPGALILLSPWADLSAGLRPPPDGTSFISNTKSDFLRGPHSQFELYAVYAYAGVHGSTELRKNVYISPASPEITRISFKNFPRTFIVSGDAENGLDAIRLLRDRMVVDMGKGDHGVLYHESVDSVHDFILFDWHEPQRSQALKEISAWLDRILP